MRSRCGLLLLGLVVACAPLRTTPETRYRGMLLGVRDLGAAELAREAAADATIREYVAREGRPDFIVVPSERDVHLVWVETSRLVHFRRPAEGGASAFGVVTPLPTPLLHFLPRDLRAGTPRPFRQPAVRCWTTTVATERCRTCCRTRESCVIDCGSQSSTFTPREKATWLRIDAAAGFGSG